MVSTFIQLLYHVIVQTNSRTVAAEGPEGVWELNTVCDGDAGAQLRDAFLNSALTQQDWRDYQV